MPSLEENRAAWDEAARWQSGGDDWSSSWGGAEAQWFGSLLPRVRHLLPAPTILEIAPGYGRWTQFLLAHCERLIGVDISPRCVAACRERFGDRPAVEFHQNDGTSLEAVPDRSVDLAFSFDSLVHAEGDVLDRYLDELTAKLADRGAAFIHHSNLGAHAAHFAALDRVPVAVRSRLEARGLIDRSHWRAPSVSAKSFAASCERAGLHCIGQEMVNWGAKRLIDCFSVVVRPGHPLDRANRVVHNPSFMAEAASTRAHSELWAADGPSSHGGR